MPSDVSWTAACRFALPPSPAAGIASEPREMVGLLSELEQSSHPNLARRSSRRARSAFSEGSGCRPASKVATREGAGVGKPEEKEPAGRFVERVQLFSMGIAACPSPLGWSQ